MTGDPRPSESSGGGQLEVARIVRPYELTSDDVVLWRELQAAHAELDRPFFAPEWFRLLDEAGHAVEIAVLAADGRKRAFVPLHRAGRAVVAPGGRLGDFQGWIGPGDLALDPRAFLDAVGARVWRFSRQLGTQQAVAAMASERTTAPLADLSAGFDAFLAEHRSRGSGWVSQVQRKARKLGREVGELRFELSTKDPDVLARLREWKRAQRERTRTSDPLDEAWAERVVASCLDANSPDFAGMLSALYAGDRLVAAHLGLRSRGTLSIWFPAYDAAWESYSPGLIMLYQLFEAASGAGVGRIDFGTGDERYKSSWKTGEEPLAGGAVDLRPVARLVGGAVATGRRRLRQTPVAEPARAARRRLATIGRRLRRR